MSEQTINRLAFTFACVYLHRLLVHPHHLHLGLSCELLLTVHPIPEPPADAIKCRKVEFVCGRALRFRCRIKVNDRCDQH